MAYIDTNEIIKPDETNENEQFYTLKINPTTVAQYGPGKFKIVREYRMIYHDWRNQWGLYYSRTKKPYE